MELIRAQHVSYTYQAGGPFEKAAIDDVSLTINKGEIVGIIGHTGSGKSTLVQHFNGLIRPTAGQLFVNGVDVAQKGTDLKALRQTVGLVFQYPEHQLFEETVGKDIAFAPKNMGLSPEQVEQRVRKSAMAVGLREEDLEKSPFELSGGQKRRVAIAGVLAMEPQVLVLDEPTAGLDPRGRDNVLALIRRLHKELGMTIVLVSHGMEDVANTVERIFVMNEGKLYMEGTPMEVYPRYQELERIGLTAPQVTRLMKELCGVDVCTVQQAMDYLLPKLQEGGTRHA